MGKQVTRFLHTSIKFLCSHSIPLQLRKHLGQWCISRTLKLDPFLFWYLKIKRIPITSKRTIPVLELQAIHFGVNMVNCVINWTDCGRTNLWLHFTCIYILIRYWMVLWFCSFAIETTFPLSNFKTNHIFGILMVRDNFLKPFGGATGAPHFL